MSYNWDQFCPVSKNQRIIIFGPFNHPGYFNGEAWLFGLIFSLIEKFMRFSDIETQLCFGNFPLVLAFLSDLSVKL